MPAGHRNRAANMMCAGLIGLIAAFPLAMVFQPPSTGEAIAIFPPGTQPGSVLAASASAGSTAISLMPGGHAARLDLPEGGAAALRQAGALLVIRPVFAAGCSTSSPPIPESAA